MQYVAFDFLWWVLAAYFVMRLLRTEDPRWCVAVGVAIGLGLMTKYSMAFFAFSIAAGLLFTEGRRYLRTKWFWIGIGMAVLICLPNVVWQWRHDFVSLEFLQHIHERDVRIGRTKDFLPDQVQFLLFALPLALAGLWFYFSGRGRRFRALGWMYLLPLVIFIALKGRGYYLIAAYPMLLAGGSVWFGDRLARLNRAVRATAWSLLGLGLAFDIVIFALVSLPIAKPGTHQFEWAIKNNGDLVEELGWPELVHEVARIRNTFSAEERPRVGILAANYGEAGALSLYGPQHGLPEPISGINSYWYRGYGDAPPETLIVLGFSQRFRDRNFTTCELAGHTPNPHNVQNEETRDHPEIFVCRGLKESWPEFWKDFHYFG
jgi:4-amino-4-deoxy-L-arabinose transferase-like glycosyltransferase